MLKGRTTANGRPQRKLSETTSPTVSTDALMLSLMIDAKEKRDIAMADVAGAHLRTDMNNFVVMKLEGENVQIFCKMNDEYEKYVTTENGKPVLYIRLLEALYGCVKFALLWYELFTNHLDEMGFEINPNKDEGATLSEDDTLPEEEGAPLGVDTEDESPDE